MGNYVSPATVDYFKPMESACQPSLFLSVLMVLFSSNGSVRVSLFGFSHFLPVTLASIRKLSVPVILLTSRISKPKPL